MTLKYKLLAAVASAAAFATPATAQEAAIQVDTGVDAQAPAGAQPDAQAGAEAKVDAQVQPGVAVETGVNAESEANAEARAEAQTQTQTQAPSGSAGAVVLATAADIREGVLVQDPQGGAVGTVEAVEADGAVVTTGSVRAKLPFESFGKNDRGLVISMTRAEFEAAVAAQTPS